MTAHGGDEEGPGAEAFEEGGRGPQDQRNVGDAAAAGRQSDGLAGPDGASQVERCESGLNVGGDVLDARSLEVLAEAHQRWIHGETHCSKVGAGVFFGSSYAEASPPATKKMLAAWYGKQRFRTWQDRMEWQRLHQGRKPWSASHRRCRALSPGRFPL